MIIHEWFRRVLEMLLGRTIGPFNFRLIVQPTVASLLAIRAGHRDARAGRTPYFWSILTHPSSRPELFRSAWKDVGKVFVVVIALDVVYELIVYRWVYPGLVLVVGIVLAIIPYLVFRGPVTRIARRFVKFKTGPHDAAS
jgi:hypothetical protein